jgi:hypothetical protein
MAGTKNTVKAGKITASMKKQIADALLRFSFELEERIRMNIRDGGGVYTGTLMGSIAAKPPREVKQGVMMEIGTPIEHGSYYEFGTAPHWAPLEPIRRWVELKIQPHVQAVAVEFKPNAAGKMKAVPKASGHKILKGASRVQEVLRAARAIQRKIAAVGTKGHFPMAHALQQLKAPYQLVPDGSGGMTYRVDLAGYLQAHEPDLWNKIAAGIAKEPNA